MSVIAWGESSLHLGISPFGGSKFTRVADPKNFATSGLVFIPVISRRSTPSLRLILLSNHHGATSPPSPAAPNLLPFLEQAPEAYLDVRL